MIPGRKIRVFKKCGYTYGITVPTPTWFMNDGWVTYTCDSWEDAMRKARRRLRGQPA